MIKNKKNEIFSNDKEFILLAIDSDISGYSFCSKKLREDIDIAFKAALKYDSFSLNEKPAKDRRVKIARLLDSTASKEHYTLESLSDSYTALDALLTSLAHNRRTNVFKNYNNILQEFYENEDHTKLTIHILENYFSSFSSAAKLYFVKFLLEKNINNDVKILDSTISKLGFSAYFKNYEEASYEDVLDAVQFDGNLLQIVPKKFRENKEIAIRAINQNAKSIEFIEKKLRNDSEILLTAISYGHKYIFYAEKELMKDKNFIINALKLFQIKEYPVDNNHSLYKDHYRNSIFYHIDINLQKDKEIIEVSLKSGLSGALEYADTKTKNDIQIIANLTKIDERIPEYASDEIKTNKEFINNLLDDGFEIDISNLDYSIINDETIFEKFLSNHYKSLQSADKKIRNNYKLALKAIGHSYENWFYLGEELKKDFNFMLEAIIERPAIVLHTDIDFSKQINYIKHMIYEKKETNTRSNHFNMLNAFETKQKIGRLKDINFAFKDIKSTSNNNLKKFAP